MGKGNTREGSWLGTRQGKGILAGIIITTVVVAAVIVPLGIIWFTPIAPLDDDKIYSQRGDTVDFVYVGSFASNNTVFDSGTIYDQIIGSNALLDYIDQQLVGMVPGVQKTFVIPAQLGYTDPSHHLYGHDLKYQVTITSLTRNGTVLYPL